MTKTNAARLLDAAGISFELRAYDVDLDDLAAESVAAKVGMSVAQVFKTLVCRGDRTGVMLAVVPGDSHVDLKALAKATGDRKVETVALKDVQPLTGYVRGGVTAIGGKKPYPVVADASIEGFDAISVSAGVRGLQIVLAPVDYLRVVHARLATIATPK